jgi:2-keto-4-pentenoate hydratase/2-oxohepta-3-ene-1,7-dioic acid hydratase in catechol pathway
MQHASLADLIFPLPTIIAYLSAFTPLSPAT